MSDLTWKPNKEGDRMQRWGCVLRVDDRDEGHSGDSGARQGRRARALERGGRGEQDSRDNIDKSSLDKAEGGNDDSTCSG